MKEENKNISENSSESTNEKEKVLIDNDLETEGRDINEESQLIEENKKLNDLLLRSRAELDNFQKRTIKQMQLAQLFSTEKLSSELLVIIDSLEAAEKLSSDPNMKIESFIEGNNLLLKTTQEVFEKLNIEEINPIDEDFDPEYHQAMTTKDSENSENKVLEVMQKGYRLKTKLLRPALVVVSKKAK